MDRRRQIVDAAHEVARTEGVGALSVRGVAERAGIGASTLRHYFPTQRTLYDAVMGELFDSQVEELRIADPRVDPYVRLTECVAQFLPATQDRVKAPLQAWLSIYSAALGPEGTEAQRMMVSALEASAYRRVEGWLAVLDREGALREGDRARQVITLLALVDGLCLALLVPDGPVGLVEARGALDEGAGALVRRPGNAGPSTIG